MKAVKHFPEIYKKIGIIFLLTLGCVAIYYKTYYYGFFNIDDDKCIYINENVTKGISLSGILWAITTFNNYRYVPITTISQQFDCQIWGLWAGGHHLTNLLIYILSVLALYAALLELTKRNDLSILVSVIYAFHPMHVETVVWITQRNDLLAGLFLFLSIYAYTRHCNNKSLFWYITSIAMYAFSVGSKGTVIGFPIILLACDYWPLKRFSIQKSLGIFLEKIPFLLLSCSSAIFNLIANHVPVEPFPSLSMIDRIANSFMAHKKYLYNIFSPYKVGSYPFYGEHINYFSSLSFAIIFVLLTILFLVLRKKHPYLIAGWIWYNAMLFPMTGLVSTIGQYFGDRYVYIAKIGLLLIFASITLYIIKKLRHSKAAFLTTDRPLQS
jgi:hypothetical protein